MAVIVLSVLIVVCAINASLAYHFKRNPLGYFVLSLVAGVTGPGPVIITLILMMMGTKLPEPTKAGSQSKEF